MDEQPRHTESTGRRPRRKLWSWLIALLLVIGGVYFFTQTNAARTIVNPPSGGAGGKGGRGGRGGRGAGTIPVVAAHAQRGNIGVYIVGLGTVTPIYTVTVKA